MEARFAEMSGVVDTAVGYEGGALDHPTYKEVCTDRTGHAEVVQVIFDPNRLPYEALLDAFFALHDPTQVNRQGPDWGTQYRSVVFAGDEVQAKQARGKIAELNASGTYRKPVATVVEEGRTFWKAPALSGEARHDLLSHLEHRLTQARGQSCACYHVTDPVDVLLQTHPVPDLNADASPCR